MVSDVKTKGTKRITRFQWCESRAVVLSYYVAHKWVRFLIGTSGRTHQIRGRRLHHSKYWDSPCPKAPVPIRKRTHFWAAPEPVSGIRCKCKWITEVKTNAIYTQQLVYGRPVVLAAGKALMTKDMSNNLFSSCKSFGALHVKVHLGEKSVHIHVLPPSARRLRNNLRHQSGRNNHYRLPYNFYIFYIPNPKIEQERDNLYHFRPCGAETRSTIVRMLIYCSILSLIVSPMELRLSRLQHEWRRDTRWLWLSHRQKKDEIYTRRLASSIC